MRLLSFVRDVAFGESSIVASDGLVGLEFMEVRLNVLRHDILHFADGPRRARAVLSLIGLLRNGVCVFIRALLTAMNTQLGSHRNTSGFLKVRALADDSRAIVSFLFMKCFSGANSCLHFAVVGVGGTQIGDPRHFSVFASFLVLLNYFKFEITSP